jgi:hypothetical protein
MLGCGPISNPGGARVCGSTIDTDQIGGQHLPLFCSDGQTSNDERGLSYGQIRNVAHGPYTTSALTQSPATHLL